MPPGLQRKLKGCGFSDVAAVFRVHERCPATIFESRRAVRYDLSRPSLGWHGALQRTSFDASSGRSTIGFTAIEGTGHGEEGRRN